MVKISAVICTHNNYTLLKKAIESLLNQSLNRDEYEILIIDNNPEEKTKQIVLTYTNTYSNVRYINEKNLGLSYARNKGIKEAKGEYIAFIDDDAEADKEWLFSLTRCFEQTKPRPDIIGGKVLLRDELADIPKYVTPIVEVYYSKLDYGNKGLLLNDNKRLTHYINGTNFAMKKEIATKIGGFNVSLGRRGKSLMSREESRFLEEAAKRDCVIYYEPKAVVTHFISNERLRKRWLIRRSFAEGVSLVLDRQAQGDLIGKSSFVKHKLKSILRDIKSYIAKPDNRFLILLEICRKTGEIYSIVSNNAICKS